MPLLLGCLIQLRRRTADTDLGALVTGDELSLVPRAPISKGQILMSRKLTLMVVGVLAGLLMSFSAQAVPASSAPAQIDRSGITLAAGGCGIGFHRSVYGYCVRNGYYAPPPPPPYYAAPVLPTCPYPYRLGPYGRCIP